MASLFRKTVTRPLPKGATIENRKTGPVAVWADRSGRKQTAPLVLDADGKPKLGPDGKPRVRTQSRTVYANVPGIGEAIPTGCRAEDAANYKLAELVKRAEHIASGILTEAEARTADHQTTPLSEHIAAYVEHLKAKGVTPGRMKQTETRLTRAADGCGWRLLADLSGTGLESWLAEKCEAGEMHAANCNAHRAAWPRGSGPLVARCVRCFRSTPTCRSGEHHFGCALQIVQQHPARFRTPLRHRDRRWGHPSCAGPCGTFVRSRVAVPFPRIGQASAACGPAKQHGNATGFVVG